MGTAAPGEGYKTNVWVSSDGRRVVVLLLNGQMADQATGDRRAAQALDSCTARPDQGFADPADRRWSWGSSGSTAPVAHG